MGLDMQQNGQLASTDVRLIPPSLRLAGPTHLQLFAGQEHRDADGGLVWTLPSRLTLTTHPPAFGTDDGSTPTVSRTGREKYADALASIGTNRPAPADRLIPF